MLTVHFKRWLVVCFFSFAGLASAVLAQDTAIKGAACLVSDAKGRVLIAKDILNNRFSIPGGYVDSDNPADAAVRETLEETGIEVVVTHELARLDSAVLFSCKATSPIEVYENRDGSAQVPAWHAKHFGREVRTVLMQQPEAMVLSETRYPKQVELLPSLLPSTAISETFASTDFSHKTSAFNAWNAQWNRHVQDAVKRLPNIVGHVIAVSSFLGDGVLFFILIPIAMATGGIPRLSQLMFITIATTLIIGYIKLTLAVPRPFYLYPELQLAQASGFAFPSGHTATAFAVWGLIYSWLKKAGRANIAIWCLPALFVALSRIYLGVHYVTDVLAGAAIGILIAAAAMTKTWQAQLLLPRTWIAFSIIAFLLSWSEHQPAFLYCSAFSLSFALSRAAVSTSVIRSATSFDKRGFGYSLFGLVTIAAAIGSTSLWSSSSIEILITNTVGFALLALWTGMAVPILQARGR